MERRTFCLGAAAVLSGCGASQTVTGPGGVAVYRIGRRDADRIPGRVVESLNLLRSGQGLPPVQLDAALSRAAEQHSRDMSRQNRPWWFGSDASNPILRAAQAGYSGRFVGEMVAETFETELQTLDAWAADPVTRAILLDPGATDVGFAWFQESGGKIWWTLNLGSRGLGAFAT